MNLSKFSCLKLQGPVLSYLIYNIIKRTPTKVVQILPLGFSIICYTVTFSSGERPRALWALLFMNEVLFCVLVNQECIMIASDLLPRHQHYIMKAWLVLKVAYHVKVVLFIIVLCIKIWYFNKTPCLAVKLLEWICKILWVRDTKMGCTW